MAGKIIKLIILSDFQAHLLSMPVVNKFLITPWVCFAYGTTPVTKLTKCFFAIREVLKTRHKKE